MHSDFDIGQTDVQLMLMPLANRALHYHGLAAALLTVEPG